MLTLKNIYKNFNKTMVLDNVNVEFKSGMNFILGPSGSGKSTLLKLLSGMDQNFKGELFFNNQRITELKGDKLSNYYYNSIGFIWQNFQLLNHLSALDNVKLILNLSDLSEKEKEKKALDMLERLSLKNIANKKVSQLSGGQKQRIAIARALIKDPEIIIADEPTGSLDKKSSQMIINILKKISKERLVIVVTHDESLVDDESSRFLLKDKIITQLTYANSNKMPKKKNKTLFPKLSFKSSFNQSYKNIKGMLLKFSLTSLILMLSSSFLLLNFSGAIKNEQQKIFDDLIKKHGDSLRDISLYSEIMSAENTSENAGKHQNKTVKQDISKIIDTYKDDPRIEHIYGSQVVNNLTISINGLTENFKVEQSNSTPVFNKIIEGRMPNHNSNEVAIPEAILKKLNLPPKDIIGKEISLKGELFDNNSNKIDVSVKNLKIVGIIDTSLKIQTPYGTNDITLEDSFIYGLDVCKNLRNQAGRDVGSLGITIRAIDLPAVIDLVDELNSKGIIPIGAFESVQDIIRLHSTTKDQSNSVTGIISVLAISITLAIAIINMYIRKSEYAILKINGFTKRNIFSLTIMEYLLVAVMSIVLFLITSPVVNMVFNMAFNVSIINGKSIVTIIAIILMQCLSIGILTSFMASNIKTINNLNTGDK